MDQPTHFNLATNVKRLESWMPSGLSLALWPVLGYIALVPILSFIPEVGPYNEKRALQIGLFLVVVGLLLSSRSIRQRWLMVVRHLPLTARWGVGLVLGGGILSALKAPATFYALVEVGHFLLLFVATGIIAAAVRRAPRQTERRILGALALSAVLYAVFFAVGYGMHLTYEEIRLWPEGGTNYANIRFFNHYQTWTLPLLGGLLLAIPQKQKTARGGVFGLIALWWALVFASNVRGTIVAMAVAAVGVGFLFRRHAKSWLFAQAAGFLAGLLMYYLLFSAGGGPPVVEKFSEGGTYSKRLQLWMTSLDMAWAYPWLGAGPMHFAWPPFHLRAGAHPHNGLFQWLSEWGGLSTMTIVSLAVWGTSLWIRQELRVANTASETANGVRVALVAAVLAAAAHAMVSGLLVTPISQLFIVLIGGWAWGRYRFEHRPTPDPSRGAHAILCVCIVAAMSVVGSSLQDLTTVEERRDALVEAVDRNRFSPRYWAQGFLHVRDPEVIEQARPPRE